VLFSVHEMAEAVTSAAGMLANLIMLKTATLLIHQWSTRTGRLNSGARSRHRPPRFAEFARH
jgi:hypothetical protein